jgi:5-methylcytosine-specific restriction endonuclease McrA
MNKIYYGFQLAVPENSDISFWESINCPVCNKSGFRRLCDKKKGIHLYCSNKCSAIGRKGYHKLESISKEISDYAYEFGITKTCEKFNITRYIAFKLSGWTRQSQSDWLKRIRERDKEKRKQRRRFKERERKAFKKQDKDYDKKIKDIRKEYQSKRFFKLSIKRHKFKFKPFELWKIAKKQKMRCFYSGLKLNNKNISVEHVIPISKGGSNTIENIVLIDVFVNKMKLNLSLSEFKNYILLLAKRINENNL